MEQIKIFSSYSAAKVLFLIAAFVTGLLIFSSIGDFKDIRGVESNVIHTLQLILEDNSLLYESPELPPYDITQYSPLYYVVSDAILTALGIDSVNFYVIRIVTRLLSIFILLCTLFSLKDLLTRLKISGSVGWMLCLVFCMVTFPWFTISRPDVLVVLFFVLSITRVLLSTQQIHVDKNAALLGVFVFLGFATKLTMAVYVLPIGIYLIVQREWRITVISFLSFLISFGLFCSLLVLCNYDLTWFKQNVVDSVNNGYDVAVALEKTYTYFLGRLGIFTLAVILLCMEALRDWKQKKNDATFLLLFILVLITLPVSLMMGLKAGSAENYFNEPVLCMILLSIYILERDYSRYRKAYLTFIMVFGVVVSFSHAIRYKYLLGNYVHPSQLFAGPDSGNRSELANLRRFMESNLGSGYFYSDDRELAMTFPDRCVLFQEDIHWNTFERNIYDYSRFENWAIDQKDLKFLVVWPHRTTLYGLDIPKHYILKERYPTYALYQFKFP